MTFSDWFSLFIVSLLGAMSPGPSLAVVVKNTLGGGRMNGILTAWSHAAGIGVYALLTLFGLVIVLKQSPGLFRGITFVGAFYLGWLGWQALRSRGGVATTLAQGKKQSAREAMRDGVLISILNPKIGLFFLALFSQVIHENAGVSGQLATVLTPLITDGCWFTVIALLLSDQKVLQKLREKAILIDRVTGLVLLFLAVRIVFFS